jgi:REP element-mobilizing transposase RayT
MFYVLILLVKVSQFTKFEAINANFSFYVYKVKLCTMKKCGIISFLLFGILHAQIGNHIHHLFGVKESVSGLFTIDALDQKTGSAVEIETLNIDFQLGGNYAYRTGSNQVYFVDSSAQFTIGFVAEYILPDLYTLNYQGSLGVTTVQSGLAAICVNPEEDSLFYAYDINGGGLTRFSVPNFDVNISNFGFGAINDANFMSMVYHNDVIYIAGPNSPNSTIVYAVEASSLQLIDSNFYNTPYLYLIAHPNLGIYVLGQNPGQENFLGSIDEVTLGLTIISLLPSCTNCATEVFAYDRNAMVIDSVNQQIIVARSESIGGANPNYFLSTYDLAGGNLVYNLASPERYSNLIFQKPVDNLVYPGDTDHNKNVDMQDILPIGLFYTEVVSGRALISTDWIGQSASNSGLSLASGTDIKHADSNGDGQINAIDYDAVALNYNYTHYSDKRTNSNCDFPMFINLPGIVKEDEPVSIQIGIDLSNQLTQNIYGITFTIEYDSNFVVFNTMNTQGINTWFGTEDLNYIQRNKDDYVKGKMDVGIVGIDKLNRSEGGILINSIWTMEDVVIPIAQSYDNMDFKITNVLIIDFDQNVIDACGLDTFIQVYDKSVGIYEIKEEVLNIFPNPTTQSFINLAYVKDLKYVEIYDMQGRRINTWYENFNNLHIGEFNKGIYFLKAYTEDKVYLNKLVYNKK